MAKLTVRNVGPIREAELEVKKHTVFIGPQGTGKSTLAKLIAIGGDYDTLAFAPSDVESEIFSKYNIENYINDRSFFSFENSNYSILLKDKKKNTVTFHREINENFIEDYVNNEVHDLENKLKKVLNTLNSLSIKDNEISDLIANLQNIKQKTSDNALKHIIKFDSVYIPAERFLISILSESIWSFSYAKINIPQSVNYFARLYEAARSKAKSMFVSFLDLHYKNQNGVDKIIISGNQYSNLSEGASGYQSIIPLLLVVENLRQQSARQFIIEEPELNLYPTAQKDLIYSLVGGLQPDKLYQDAEWVITTHSPYILSSFNTLMLAYKVGNQSDELRVEVEKIIPSRCWINPDEFAAYYVDNGTVRSIVSEQTGLIAENELDDVSDDLADEQDKLLALRRSVTRA